jgi:KDO2-lipid IV(A) lauroyltransferase
MVQLVRAVFFFIPWRIGAKATEYLAMFIFFFLPRESRTLHRNLDIVFRDTMSRDEKNKLARRNIRSYGRSFFEFIKFGLWPKDKIRMMVKETEGMELFDKARDEGRGIIAVTAHLGNWELLGPYNALRGYNTGAVAKKLFDDRIDRAVSALRARTGLKLFDRDKGAREMIKELKGRNLILGILADQDTSVDSVYVPFLGVNAKTPSGPASLAQRLGLYICTIFIYRRKDGYYGIKVNKPFDIAGLTTEQIAVIYNEQISEMIMKYPEQWVWVHRRFRMTVEKKMEEEGIKL